MNTPCNDEGTLIALLDGELPLDEATRLEAHLEGCEPCVEALRELRLRSERVGRWMERHDPPTPALSAYRMPRQRRPFGRATAWAAAASVVLATAVLAGPGPEWIMETLGLREAVGVPGPRAVTDATSFEPVGSTLTLVFEGADRPRRLTIRRTDEGLVTMRTPGPATELLVRPGVVEVREADPGATDYVIELPAGVERVTLRVPGQTDRVVPVEPDALERVVELPAGGG